jgi:hypothetical protein
VAFLDEAKSKFTENKAMLGEPKPAVRPKLDMHVHEAHSGGFAVDHAYRSPAGEEPREPEQHVVSDLDQLHNHITKYYGTSSSS